MGKNITNTTQISLFETIKTRLKTSTVLNTKFKDTDYYQFEPNYKSKSFPGFPCIIIEVPLTENEHVSMDHSVNNKQFDITITLIVEYEARDKYVSYSTAIIDTLEKSEQNFEDIGYFNLNINSDKPEPEFLKEKEVITGTHNLMFEGTIQR